MKIYCFFLLAAGCAALCCAAPVPVMNPGFEEAGDGLLPSGWHGDGKVYARDTAVAHSGAASLKYTNDDPGRYVLCTQSVELKPGRIYAFSAWVRSQGITGEESGATLCIEYRDKEGKYLGGRYPAGVKGDTEWTLLRDEMARIPEEAVSFTLSCYVRRGMTGTAWFDDVAVEEIREDPMKTVLLYPNYRSEPASGAKHARAGVLLNLRDYEEELEDVYLADRKSVV